MPPFRAKTIVRLRRVASSHAVPGLAATLVILLVAGAWAEACAGQTTNGRTFANSPTTAKSGTKSREGSVPDLSGIWERRDESGSGSFGGLSEKTPPASITPYVKKIDEEARAKMAAGQVQSYASRYCQYLGMPFLMGQSPPIDIVQGKDETLIMSEQSSAARHIYTDGRGHPDSSTYEPTTNGHSIGYWEGDTFVVDTIGFNDLGANFVPGGGLRTPTSHLVEHMRLLDGGQRLSITFTWEDPKVYLRPYTYEIVYHKDPPETYVYEDFCDAGDPAQGRSIVPPPQN